MTFLAFIAAAFIGYIFGAIPFGYIYVKLFKGIDIRTVGSGRTGGTNSLRAAGPVVGVLTGLSDVAKGYIGVWLTRLLLTNQVTPELVPWLVVTAGILSVFGHNWSVFMGWRGGAGTGPNVGWGTAVWWPMFPVSLIVMIGTLLTVGMASVASMAMGVIIFVIFLLLYLLGIPPYDSTLAYIVGGLITTAIVFWALRPNIKRLFNGTERVVGPRARRMAKRAQQKENPTHLTDL